jgi:hypothetical protein
MNVEDDGPILAHSFANHALNNGEREYPQVSASKKTDGLAGDMLNSCGKFDDSSRQTLHNVGGEPIRFVSPVRSASRK